MNKKYELTDKTINHYGTVLHRIKALRSFGIVKAGDLGGFIESEDNLSHDGDCWVFDDAIVKDKAKVLYNATVAHNAQVLDYAIVKDYTTVADYATVTGHSKVYDHSIVVGNARINGTSEIHGETAVVGGNADVTDANIYDNAKVTDGVIIGSTINGDTLIDTHVYLKDNAYISSASDYFSINMNDIMATFYLSKDKDIYFSFRNHEYKLDDLNSYSKDLNNIAAFQMLVELAKKYLLREKNMDCQEITDVAIKEIQETPLQQYLKEAGINDNFFYEYKNCSRELTIFTKIPGVWIGFQGTF